MVDQIVYLDNNATTAVAPEVLEAMLPFLREHFGNASSTHVLGRGPARAVARARRETADLFGAASPDEVVFTSGGTEASNLALIGTARARTDRPRLVIGGGEHPATRQPVERLAEIGCEPVTVPLEPSGRLDLARALEAIDERTAVASFLWVNNETGVQLEDEVVERLAARCREVGARLHLDAVQAAGKLPLRAEARGVDLLSISAHKFHGPKGVGALYVREGTELRPLAVGGGQEGGRRPGTLNTPGIVGLGAAAVLAARAAEDAALQAELETRRTRFEAELARRVEGIVVHGREALRVPTTSSIGFPGIAADGLHLLLSELGVCASTGAACSSGSRRTSPVLAAMGVPDDLAAGTLRFSFARTTTDADIELALERIAAAVEQLRALSPR